MADPTPLDQAKYDLALAQKRKTDADQRHVVRVAKDAEDAADRDKKYKDRCDNDAKMAALRDTNYAKNSAMFESDIAAKQEILDTLTNPATTELQ